MTNAIKEIAAERQRQIEAEGWTTEHDDEHNSGDLAAAAGCYALGFTRVHAPDGKRIGTRMWPWDIKWWKPGTDRRRQLVKAGALIVAEIERLDRLTP